MFLHTGIRQGLLLYLLSDSKSKPACLTYASDMLVLAKGITGPFKEAII